MHHNLLFLLLFGLVEFLLRFVIFINSRLIICRDCVVCHRCLLRFFELACTKRSHREEGFLSHCRSLGYNSKLRLHIQLSFNWCSVHACLCCGVCGFFLALTGIIFVLMSLIFGVKFYGCAVFSFFFGLFVAIVTVCVCVVAFRVQQCIIRLIILSDVAAHLSVNKVL